MNETEEIMSDGVLFAIYDTGPWFGFKADGKQSMNWIGAGEQTAQLMVRCNLNHEITIQ